MRIVYFLIIGLISVGAYSDDEVAEPEEEPVAEPPAPEVVEERRKDEAALEEDPEAQRRALAKIPVSDEDAAPAAERPKHDFEFYASARVHAINTINLQTGNRTDRISDGNSRIGFRGEYQFKPGWWFYGRAEAGVDLVERFSTRGDLFGEGGITERLLFAGIDHENITLTYGKNWGAYYKVAGMTDRFAIFGGSASGTYNAGTSGQATGTGRADDVIQARIYVDPKRWTARFKPFNLNLQYQFDQPIPNVMGERYARGFAASATLETQKEFMLGIAYNRSDIDDPSRPAIAAAGIDGDATALALATRWYGDHWYASLLYSHLENMELTDQGRYVHAEGIEFYAQWEFRDNWWLIGGGNWLNPDENDPMQASSERTTPCGGGVILSIHSSACCTSSTVATTVAW